VQLKTFLHFTVMPVSGNFQSVPIDLIEAALTTQHCTVRSLPILFSCD